MHGVKPEHAPTQSEEALEGVAIPTRRENLSTAAPVTAVAQSNAVQLQPEVVKRFEEIMKQELDGSSFSTTVDRGLETNVRTATSQASKLDPSQRKLRPLSKARRVTEYPLEGLTILDKLVSLMAYLLKRLEQRLLGGQRKPLTLHRLRQTLAAKKSREEKARAKAKQQKLQEKKHTPGKEPLRGPAING
jgi:hypothetical protein